MIAPLRARTVTTLFFIDETSMGEPWTEFGKWFGERYCRAPSIMDQIAGMKEHRYIKLTQADYDAIKTASESMGVHHGIALDKLLPFMENHIGKHISTENW